jgi:hypothetical protein
MTLTNLYPVRPGHLRVRNHYVRRLRRRLFASLPYAADLP